MNGHNPIGDLALSLLERSRHRFESYRGAAYAGEDSEAIHQMRVSARRFRATLRAFAPVLPQPVRNLEAELRWIAVSLGNVRDIDVQAKLMPDISGAILALREVRLGRLRQDLDSQRFTNLMEAMGSGAPAGDVANLAAAPVLAVSPDIVRRAFGSVRRMSLTLDESSEPVAIHTLRKRVKTLRYTVDGFVKLYGNPGKAFVASIKGLQDLLGEHQDRLVAQGFCRELEGQGIDARLEEYAQHSADEAAKLRLELPDALESLADRWKPLKRRMKRERRRLWDRHKESQLRPVSD